MDLFVFYADMESLVYVSKLLLDLLKCKADTKVKLKFNLILNLKYIQPSTQSQVVFHSTLSIRLKFSKSPTRYIIYHGFCSIFVEKKCP